MVVQLTLYCYWYLQTPMRNELRYRQAFPFERSRCTVLKRHYQKVRGKKKAHNVRLPCYKSENSKQKIVPTNNLATGVRNEERKGSLSRPHNHYNYIFILYFKKKTRMFELQLAMASFIDLQFSFFVDCVYTISKWRRANFTNRSRFS